MKYKVIVWFVFIFLSLNSQLFARKEPVNFGDTLMPSSNQTAHSGGTFAVLYSPSGKWMGSCGLDETVKIWDVQTNRVIKILKGHSGEVTTIAISPDGKYLVSAEYDKRIIIWETNTWKKLRVIELDSWSTALSFNHKGQLAVGLQNGIVKIIEVATGISIRTFDTGFGVNSLSFADAGQTIITGGPVTAWEAATGKKIKEFRLPGGVNGIAIAAATSYFVSVHSRGMAYINDLHTGDTIFTYTERRKSNVPASTGSDEYMVKLPIIACAFSGDGKQLALSCYGNKILIFNPESHLVQYVLKGFHSPVTTITFSQDGKRLAGGTGDGKIMIWELK